MVKTFFTLSLLFLLVPIHLTYAQTGPGNFKIYSGNFHRYNKLEGNVFRSLFSKKPVKKENEVYGRKCSIEFKSPIPYSHESVTIVPKEMTYVIKFLGRLNGKLIKDKGAFKKFVINIYTHDDEEYTIDPFEEGKQVAINDVHHIYDSYLIYLILGRDIDHLEIVSTSQEDQDKYLLDKLEVKNGA